MLRALAVSVLLSAVTAQGWVDRTPANPLAGPTNRMDQAMCWDAAHGYVLMFGGYDNIAGSRFDTWTWNGTAWTQRIVANPPVVGSGWPSNLAMAFHPPTGEVVLVCAGETYTWNGTNWLHRNVQVGNPGSSPANIAMSHDPGRGQTVLFVGRNGGNPASETYLWNGFNWIPQTTSYVPFPVDSPSMAFDPVAGRLLLATTGNGQSAYFEWTGSNWQQRYLAGAPAAAGPIATDTAHQQIVMLDAVMSSQPHHTYTIVNGTITHLPTPTEPGRRSRASMAYDQLRGKVVLFGGGIQTSPQGQMLMLGDTWEFELGAGASYTTFGTGCAGSRGAPTLTAQAGSTPRVGQTFQANVGNLPFTSPVFLFVGISNTTYGPTPLPFDLGGLGAPGCSVLSSGEDLRLLTNVLGSALWQWTIPNAPGVSFYNQAFVFDPAANALGITVSNAGHGTIGF